MYKLMHSQSRGFFKWQRQCIASIVNGGRSASSNASHPPCSYWSGNLVNWDVESINGGSSNERFVGKITLNAPSTYNALTVEMGQEFSALCRQLSHDISSGVIRVDAVILTGQGPKAFSAGGNLDWLQSLKDNPVHANADLMLRFYKSFLCIRELPVPVIAAMQGPAIGAGAGLALACDLRVAARRTTLGLNFTRLGIHTGMGAAHLLQHALPRGNAIRNEILLTGRTLSAEECFDYGLVNRLSDDDDDVQQTAIDLVKDITLQTHPVAVRTLLQTLRTPIEADFYEALHRDAFAQALCYARHDWGEGVKAVAEKRDAVFDNYHAH